jgi:hypothetical protein
MIKNANPKKGTVAESSIVVINNTKITMGTIIEYYMKKQTD